MCKVPKKSFAQKLGSAQKGSFLHKKESITITNKIKYQFRLNRHDMKAVWLICLAILFILISGCLTPSEEINYKCYDGSIVKNSEDCPKMAEEECNPFPIENSIWWWEGANGASCEKIAENLEIRGKYIFAKDTKQQCEIKLRFTFAIN